MYYFSKYGKIYYDIIGCQGDYIVFLHGWGQDSTTFKNLYDELNDEYRILVIDLLGFGKSDDPNVAFTLDRYVDTIHEIIINLEICKPVIIGHSLGGRIAVKYYYRYQNAKQLFLISSAGIKPKRTLKYYYQIYKYKFKKRVFKLFRLTYHLCNLQKESGSSDFRQASPVMKHTLSLVVNEDLRKIFKKVDVFTVLLWGIYDEVTPYSDALIFAKEIKNSRLITFYNSNHFPHLTETKKMIKVIKKYLIREGKDGTN